MANSAPAANVTLLAVTSVPAVSGWTVVPGWSASVPPAVCIEPGSKAIAPPLISVTSAPAGREIAALMVIAPLAAAPIVRVPAVMLSSSSSVKPSVSGLPASTSSPPKSIRVPAVRGRRTTAFAPASTEAVDSRLIESAVSVTVGVPTVPDTRPVDSSWIPTLHVPSPAVPITSISPPLDVI